MALESELGLDAHVEQAGLLVIRATGAVASMTISEVAEEAAQLADIGRARVVVWDVRHALPPLVGEARMLAMTRQERELRRMYVIACRPEHLERYEALAAAVTPLGFSVTVFTSMSAALAWGRACS